MCLSGSTEHDLAASASQLGIAFAALYSDFKERPGSCDPFRFFLFLQPTGASRKNPILSNPCAPVKPFVPIFFGPLEAPLPPGISAGQKFFSAPGQLFFIPQNRFRVKMVRSIFREDLHRADRGRLLDLRRAPSAGVSFFKHPRTV